MSIRIESKVVREPPVSIEVDGVRVEAHPGESVAAALFALGIRCLRRSPRRAEPRGAFCLMGSCQECVVLVDGRRTTACQEPVRSGMVVLTGGGG